MKRDLYAVTAVAALAAAVFFVTRETPAGAPATRDPYRAAASEEVLVRYAAEGGLGPIASCEIEVRGPGACLVRCRPAAARPSIERIYPLSQAGFDDLMRRLARADFFEADETPRAAVHADQARVTLALTIGPRSHEIVIDGRRRPTKDMGAVLDFFDAIRRAATPEPVSAGD